MPSEPITSLQNQRVKDAAKLRDHRQRHKQGRILIDGARELLRAIEAGVELIEIFVCEALAQSADAKKILQLGARSRAEIVPVTPPVFAKLAFGDRADGILGVAAPPRRELAAFELPKAALVAVVEGVEKPGNVGAILRSADAAGVAALIVVEGGTDLYNPNTIRASLGTIFTVPVFAADAATAIAWLRQRGLRMFAARLDADRSYTAADFRGPTAVVLGSEAHGLTAAWSAAGVTPICLPMQGVADSLNVSATAAVLFYEALRQRREAKAGADF